MKHSKERNIIFHKNAIVLLTCLKCNYEHESTEQLKNVTEQLTFEIL